MLASTYDEQGKLKTKGLNWMKINKDTNMHTQEVKKGKTKKSFLWKKGKTKSISGMKKSKKKISHKHMKSSIPIGRHKREMSLDRFRDELNKFKSNRNKEGIQVSTARLARGHQKTKSDLSLAYFKSLETQGGGKYNKNYLKFRRNSGSELDFENIRKAKKKSDDVSGKDVRKM